MSNDQIKVTMCDTNTDKEITRDIDISNFTNWDTGRTETNPDLQREMLNEWIEDRANPQHETKFALVSWYIF